MDLVEEEEGAEDSWEGSEKGKRKVAVKHEEPSIALVGITSRVEDHQAGKPAIKSEDRYCEKGGSGRRSLPDRAYSGHKEAQLCDRL